MFGRFYHRRDAELAGGQRSNAAAGAYACMLLAELLDRASVLSGVRTGDRPLQLIIDLFLLDVEEARARGLRARLFCRTPDGRLDPWSVDPNDDLNDIGGSLVPAVTPWAIATEDAP
jgi:hypothetical protein